jgi:hypothetical protein
MTSKAKRNRVKELWLGIPESWRTELASAFHTFVPVFALSLLGALSSLNDVPLEKEAILSLSAGILGAALRAGFKAVSVAIFSRVLPDPKEGTTSENSTSGNTYNE